MVPEFPRLDGVRTCRLEPPVADNAGDACAEPPPGDVTNPARTTAHPCHVLAYRTTQLWAVKRCYLPTTTPGIPCNDVEAHTLDRAESATAAAHVTTGIASAGRRLAGNADAGTNGRGRAITSAAAEWSTR